MRPCMALTASISLRISGAPAAGTGSVSVSPLKPDTLSASTLSGRASRAMARMAAMPTSAPSAPTPKPGGRPNSRRPSCPRASNTA